MPTTLKTNANRLNMADPLPTASSYGVKPGIFKPCSFKPCRFQIQALQVQALQVQALQLQALQSGTPFPRNAL
jgi:hypothetical protein